MVVTYTKGQVVYQELRSRILSGEILPDSVLNQETLAAQMGVSTTPLREALQRLEAERLVSLRAHREVTVAPLSVQELAEIFSIRLQLDPYAGALAAVNATDDELKMIEASVPAPSSSENKTMGDENRRFHRAIYVCSRNHLLTVILDSLWDRTECYRRILVPDDIGGNVDPEPTHKAIAAALSDRNAVVVADLLKRHIEATEDMLRSLLIVRQERSGRPGTP